MVWFSYHGGHSGEFCGHAKDSLEEVVCAAIDAGFTHYGLSEHSPRYREAHLFPEERELGVAGLEERFEAYAHEARRLQAAYADRIEIIVGFETEKLPDESWAADMLGLRKRFGFEYMVGSVHHLDARWVDFSADETEKLAEECGDVDAMQARYFDSLCELVETLRPEVVGHIDLIRKFGGMDVRLSPAVWPRIERALDAVHNVEARIDVNCGAFRRQLSPVYPLPAILSRAREMGIGATLGDDGHGAATVGVELDASLHAIAEAGYTEVDYLTRDVTAGRARWQSAPISEVRPAGR